MSGMTNYDTYRQDKSYIETHSDKLAPVLVRSRKDGQMFKSLYRGANAQQPYSMLTQYDKRE